MKKYLTGLKFGGSLVLTLLAFKTAGDIRYAAAGLLELLAIYVISIWMLDRSKRAAGIFNSIAVLLYNIQMLVMFFGNSFVVLVMLTNIPSLRGLSGKAVPYSLGAILVLVFSFLPITKWERRADAKKTGAALAALIALECFLLFRWGDQYSPFAAYGSLVKSGITNYKITKEIKQGKTEGITEAENSRFYSAGITDYRTKDAALQNQPNIVLILSEGFSERILEDERGIAENIKEYRDKSLSFSDYYDHTFATYRAVIGQLYSGYQLNNLDQSGLVSLQSILHDQGYETVFLNVQPFNTDFTEYMESMGFDELLGSQTDPMNGKAQTMSDKDAYRYVYERMMKQREEDPDTPLFIVTYLFGTHASLNSADEMYGDKTSSVLNKFYNADVQFGTFAQMCEENGVFKDTVLVYTADHAAWIESDFSDAFPDMEREDRMLDTIPFFIYYDGIKPETVNAEGRNSLDFAPTLLDYLDISAPNYFLGESLFSPTENDSIYDTVFYAEGDYLTSEGAEIKWLTGESLEAMEAELKDYFTLKAQSCDQTE